MLKENYEESNKPKFVLRSKTVSVKTQQKSCSVGLKETGQLNGNMWFLREECYFPPTPPISET